MECEGPSERSSFATLLLALRVAPSKKEGGGPPLVADALLGAGLAAAIEHVEGSLAAAVEAEAEGGGARGAPLEARIRAARIAAYAVVKEMVATKGGLPEAAVAGGSGALAALWAEKPEPAAEGADGEEEEEEGEEEETGSDWMSQSH